MFLLGFFFFFKLTFLLLPTFSIETCVSPTVPPPFIQPWPHRGTFRRGLGTPADGLGTPALFTGSSNPPLHSVVCPSAYVSPTYLDGRDRSPALKSFISQAHFLYFAEVCNVHSSEATAWCIQLLFCYFVFSWAPVVYQLLGSSVHSGKWETDALLPLSGPNAPWGVRRQAKVK